MGSNTSKPSNDTATHIQKKVLDLSGSANPDPRSPTPEITRTPLQGKSGAKHNITKNADLRKSFEAAKDDDKFHNNPILSAVIRNHLQSYDPRSPTQDFERTPIIIALKLDDIAMEKRAQLQKNGADCGSLCLKNDHDNENYDSCVEAQESPHIIVPKNLANGFLDLTLNDTIKDSYEPLGSSTASNEAIESNISSAIFKPTQLLETNFDYIEPNNCKTELSKASNNSTDDIDQTQGDTRNVPVFKMLDKDPRSPSTGIERTPIVVANTEKELCEDNVENMSDDTLIKVLQNTNVELRQSVKTQDNPDGLMIYEDDPSKLNDTPKKSKSAGSSGSRTPLSCMKNKADGGHTRSKSDDALHDSKERKTNRRVSHIPRLKSLTKQTKLNPVSSSISLKNISKCSGLGGDCENTPPQSHRDRWDKDTSMVL